MSNEPGDVPGRRYPMRLQNIGQETDVEMYDYGEYANARLIKLSVETAWTMEWAFAGALNVANRIMSA